MPYITQTARHMIADGGPVETAGELNYVVTKAWLETAIGVPDSWEKFETKVRHEISLYINYHGVSYKVVNDVMGALDCARREIKRRRDQDVTLFRDIANEFYDAVAAAYEDQKIQQNGDLF